MKFLVKLIDFSIASLLPRETQEIQSPQVLEGTFDIQTQTSILAKVRQVLRPNGYLFLGGGETTVNPDSAFDPVQFEKGVCYRSRVTT